MSSSGLIRWCGLAAALSGVLLVVGNLVNLTTLGARSTSEAFLMGTQTVATGLVLLALVLLLLGLVGLYANQAQESGVLGLIGFLAAFAGTALVLGVAWAQAFVWPTLAEEATGVLNRAFDSWRLEQVKGPMVPAHRLSFTLGSLGWLVFGVATLRARVYPRWAVLLLIIGAVISFVRLPATGVVLAVAIAWLGIALFMGRSDSTKQPSRVR